MPASILGTPLNDGVDQTSLSTLLLPEPTRKRSKSNPPGYKPRGLLLRDYKSPNAEPGSILYRDEFGSGVLVNRVLVEWVAKKLTEIETKRQPAPKPGPEPEPKSKSKARPNPKPKPKTRAKEVFCVPHPPQPPHPPQLPQLLHAPVAIRPHSFPTPPNLTPPLTPRIPDEILKGLYPTGTVFLPPNPVFYQQPTSILPGVNPGPPALQAGLDLGYLCKLLTSAQHSVVGPAFPLPNVTPTPFILPPINSEFPIIHSTAPFAVPMPITTDPLAESRKRKINPPLPTPVLLRPQGGQGAFSIPEKRVKLHQPMLINNNEIKIEPSDDITYAQL